MANRLDKPVCVGLDMKFWPDVENKVKDALKNDGGRMTTSDIKRFIEQEIMQLWAVHDGEILATMVTQIVVYPRLKALRVLTLSGEGMDEWLDIVLDTLQGYGKEKGANVIEMIGREGWGKRLKKEGWETKQIVMTRSIK